MADVKWIKICTDIFDDEKILLIEDMPERDAIIVIWFKLLCMAGKQNNDGIFIMNDKIAYTDEMLAAIFRRPLNTVRLALKVFEGYGMIEIINDTITIPNWEKHQNLEALRKKREDSRKRMAAYRARQRTITDASDGEVVLGHALPSRSESGEIMLGDGGVHGGNVNACGGSVDADERTCGGNVENTIPPYGGIMENPAQNGVTRNADVTCAFVTPLDVDEDKEHLSTSTAVDICKTPTLGEVIDFFEAQHLSVDPRRFFRVNQERGWVTSTGRAIDDWKRLAKTWDTHERTPAKASVTDATRVPSVEEVMTKYECDRGMAEAYIREGLF